MTEIMLSSLIFCCIGNEMTWSTLVCIRSVLWGPHYALNNVPDTIARDTEPEAATTTILPTMSVHRRSICKIHRVRYMGDHRHYCGFYSHSNEHGF
jgi:hypothetical protein